MKPTAADSRAIHGVEHTPLNRFLQDVRMRLGKESVWLAVSTAAGKPSESNETPHQVWLMAWAAPVRHVAVVPLRSGAELLGLLARVCASCARATERAPMMETSSASVVDVRIVLKWL